MQGESFLKHIKQGARDGIPVLRRNTLTLNHARENCDGAIASAAVMENSTAVQPPFSGDSSPAIALPVAAPLSSETSNGHHTGFDFALFERLRACAPELTLLTEVEVAALLRVSVKKIQNDRYTKKGLKFLKFNGVIRYLLRTVLEELAKG